MRLETRAGERGQGGSSLAPLPAAETSPGRLENIEPITLEGAPAMLRLLQTSRPAPRRAAPWIWAKPAATLRERRFAAFERTLALALSEQVNLVLIVGDLFDSNAVSRALGRAGSRQSLAGLAGAGIRTRDPARRPRPRSTPRRSTAPSTWRRWPARRGSVDRPRPGRRRRPGTWRWSSSACGSPPASRPPDLPDDRWRVGLVHRPVRPRDDEIAGAGSTTWPSAGPHEAASGSAADVAWGASGAPDLVDAGRDRAGEILLVRLDERGDRRAVAVERQRVGTTRFEAISLDLAAFPNGAALERRDRRPGRRRRRGRPHPRRPADRCLARLAGGRPGGARGRPPLAVPAASASGPRRARS